MEHRNHHHGPTTRRQALGEINGNTARENTNAGKNALAAKRGYVFVLALKYYTRDDDDDDIDDDDSKGNELGDPPPRESYHHHHRERARVASSSFFCSRCHHMFSMEQHPRTTKV